MYLDLVHLYTLDSPLGRSSLSDLLSLRVPLHQELFFLVFNLILQDFQPFFQDLKRF
jgi:hypothetical protein